MYLLPGFKIYIEKPHECVTDESVQITMSSFVRICISFFQKMCFNFTKIKKFQLISYGIFLKPAKSAFLTMYQNETPTQMLVTVQIFIKKPLNEIVKFFSWASFTDDHPLKTNYLKIMIKYIKLTF
jgi:hypothetical protein